MGQDFGISRLPLRCARRAFTIGALGCAITFSVPAAAQTTATSSSTSTTSPVPVAPVPDCLSRTAASATGGPATLYIACHGRAFVIGPARTYHLIANKRLGATLVDVDDGLQRRIWLVSFDAEGAPVLEDITGALATLAGRNRFATIDGMTVDTTTFPVDGLIHLKSTAGATGPAAAFDVGQAIVAEQGRVKGLAGFQGATN